MSIDYVTGQPMTFAEAVNIWKATDTSCLLRPAAPFCRHNRTSTLNTTTLEDPRPPKRYELTVHNRFIGVCAQAATLEEIANALRAQAELFEALNDPY